MIKFWPLIEALNICFEFLIVYIYFDGLFQLKGFRRRQIFAAYTFAGVILFVVNNIFQSMLVDISATFAIILLLAVLLYDESIVKKIFYSILFIVLVFISELILIGTLSAMGVGRPDEIVDFGMFRIFGMAGTKLLYFWFSDYTGRIARKKENNLPLNQWAMIILTPAISLLVLCVIFFSLMNNLTGFSESFYLCSALGLLYINWSVFDFIENYSKAVKVTVLEQVLKYQEDSYRMLEHTYTELRHLRHDMKQYVSILEGIIKSGDKKSAENLLATLRSGIEDNRFYYTGEPYIDAIINVKYEVAKELGIEFSATIVINEFKLNAFELSKALGNILDNAIEACERKKDGDKQITLILRQDEEHIIIYSENTSDYVDTNNMQTKKIDRLRHGIGMKSIEASIESLGGIINYNYEDGKFKLSAVALNSDKDAANNASCAV